MFSHFSSKRSKGMTSIYFWFTPLLPRWWGDEGLPGWNFGCTLYCFIQVLPLSGIYWTRALNTCSACSIRQHVLWYFYRLREIKQDSVFLIFFRGKYHFIRSVKAKKLCCLPMHTSLVQSFPLSRRELEKLSVQCLELQCILGNGRECWTSQKVACLGSIWWKRRAFQTKQSMLQMLTHLPEIQEWNHFVQ